MSTSKELLPLESQVTSLDRMEEIKLKNAWREEELGVNILGISTQIMAFTIQHVIIKKFKHFAFIKKLKKRRLKTWEHDLKKRNIRQMVH